MAIYNFETIDDKAFKLIAFGEIAILSKSYNFSIQSNNVEVYNVNDRSDILCAFKDFSEYSINGSTFASVEDLQLSLYETVFKTALGGSNATSKLYKYAVDVFNDLSALTDAEEGDIARVYNKQGVWILGTLKPEGAYTYLSGVWEYGSRSLQTEILNNDIDILALQNEQVLQNTDLNNLELNKLDKFQTAYHLKDINDLLDIHPANASNEIELSNAVYYIDSLDFDLGVYKLVTNVDTAIHGYSQLLNQMTSNEDNISMITSTGNLFLFDIRFNCTGVNSQVITMTGTGTESLDMKYVELSFGTTGGTINGIRQFFWFGGFGIGGRGFLLQGDISGARISNTRVINFMDYVLKGDTGMTIGNIRSDANITIPSGSVAYDFDYDMITEDEGYQITDGFYDGDGLMVSPFTTGDTLTTEDSRKSFFTNNKGVASMNTFVGGYWLNTTEVTTTISTIDTPVKLNGVTTYFDLSHFTQTSSNSFVKNTDNNNEFIIQGSVTIDGNPNRIFNLIVRKWNDFNSIYEDLITFSKNINNFSGGDDRADFNILVTTNMSVNDRIELWVSNSTDTSNVTMKNSSQLIISKR